jgi:Uma2 family endonuclease
MAIRTNSGLKLTYEDYSLIPEDGLRHEILDGEHYVSASPVPYHQFVSGRLYVQLYHLVFARALGTVFHAPIDVHLSIVDVVVPDLIVILKEGEGIIGPKKVEGAPDLVVEILSESTKDRDQTLKKERYRLAGVPEYWIVDPDRHVVRQFVLQRERYRLVGEHAKDVTLQRLPGVRIDLTEVW